MSIKEVIKEKYGQQALRVVSGSSAACCGPAPSSCCSTDPITSNLYDLGETSQLPEAAVLASLGCGNPAALAELKPGETSLTWAAAVESTFCFPPSASDLQARPTAWT